MRDRWWGVIAFLIGALVFGQVLLFDTAELPLPAGGDALLWVGAVLAAVLGALAFSRLRGFDAKRWAIGGGVAVAGFFVAFVAFQAVLLGTMSPDAGSISVELADGEPRARLDPNATYRETPELAKALDQLVHTNATEITVARDAKTVDRIYESMTERHSNVVGTWQWRWATIRISHTIS